MAVTFNPDTGIVVEDGQTVRSNIAANWVEAFKTDDDTPDLNTEPETPAGQLIDGQAALVIQKDNEMMQLANMFNPATATGRFQDALAKIYFITRHIAQSTLVTCTCRGLTGTRIPLGAIVENADGQRLEATQSATIGDDGTASIVFACVNTGPIVIGAESVNKIITVIPGWDSVENESAGILGRDIESQQEFEERRINSVAKNSHGLAESVGGSVSNLDNVVACRIEQNRTDDPIETMGITIPPHSVYLSVYGGDSQDIGMTIHNKLDAGCGTAGNTSVQIEDPTNGSLHTYYYTTANLTDLYVKITTAKGATYNPDDVKQAIINNFSGNTDEFTRVIMGDELFASRFYQTVISAGLTELLKIELSKNNSDFGTSVGFDLDEMPSLSMDDISFVEDEQS